MFDKKMVQNLIGNGCYHVVMEIANLIKCYDCGNEIRQPRFRAIDGQIVEVSGSIVAIKSLDGKELMVELERIIRIESYDETGKAGYQENHRKNGRHA